MRGIGRATVGFNYEKVKNWPIPSVTDAYGPDDCVRFARGIGCGAPGTLCEDEQRFLGGEALQALPMMTLALNEGVLWTQDPDTCIDWTQTIHAEECLTLHRPLATQGTLRADHKVIEIYDKGPGKGALMYENRTLCQLDGTPVAELRIATFLMANGGLGGSRARSPQPHAVPTDRPPDASIELRAPNAGDAIYRLGDAFVGALRLNDLAPGQVVLRGVCAFGVAGRGLLKLCCDMDPARMRCMSLRYAAAMYSDETIVVDVWHQAPGEAAFQVRSLERGVLLLKNGHLEFQT